MAKVARQATRTFVARNARWNPDAEDLQQQAWLEMLEAKRTFRPYPDAAENLQWFNAYCLRVVYRRLPTYLRMVRHPVHVPRSARGNSSALEIKRASENAAPVVATEPHTLQLALRLVAVIRAELAQHMLPEEVIPAMEVAVLKYRPAEVAEEHGIPAVRLHRTTQHVRRLLRTDERLAEIASALEESCRSV